jgi:hypothetical protein
VRVLSEVFRGKLLAMFEHAIACAKIPAERDHDAKDRLKRAAAKRWVVYCKPPFAGPDQVLAYLARYTHRIAISNDRLVSLRESEGNINALRTLAPPPLRSRSQAVTPPARTPHPLGRRHGSAGPSVSVL